MDTQRITGAARQMSGRLRRVAGDSGREAYSVASQRAEEAYDEALDLGARAMRQARGRALHLADDALEAGQALYGRGSAALSRQAGDHPLVLIAAAALTGAAIAWLLSSSSQRR
ncbi:MAG: CsbD family protein [Xanthobacteraceae bacterium]|jgi:hypothetical protein|nr:CsbD family protein [Xanthobacteraceae bacterium]